MCNHSFSFCSWSNLLKIEHVYNFKRWHLFCPSFAIPEPLETSPVCLHSPFFLNCSLQKTLTSDSPGRKPAIAPSVHGFWWIFHCFAAVYQQGAQCLMEWHVALPLKSRGIHNLTWTFILQFFTEILFEISPKTEAGKHNSFHQLSKHN